LSAYVAELTPHSKKKVRLLSKRSDLLACDGGFLHTHVCISDFGHGSEVEHRDEEKNEASRAEISPLHVFKTIAVINGVGEENTRCEERCYECTNTLDALSEIETDFTVSWRAADGKEVVCSCFEGAETGTNDEHWLVSIKIRLEFK
jgi:hypothetical protein